MFRFRAVENNMTRLVLALMMALVALPATASTEEAQLIGSGVLNQYLGTWQARTVMSPTKLVPRGYDETAAQEVKWVLSNQYLEMTTIGESQDSRDMINYADGSYHRFNFTSEGDSSYWIGDWQDDRRTMVWKMDLGIISGLLTEHFLSIDEKEVTLVLRDAAGNIIIQAQATQSRTETQ